MTETRYPAFGVLLVDDEPAWLRSLAMTLEGPGGITNIVTCQDSRQVLALLDQQEIGVVLLDLTMPHLSGEDLLEQIQEVHPELTVIVLSGLNQLETAVACMRRGAFDYLVKTVEEERILDAVRRAVMVQELLHENREMRSRLLSERLEHPEAFSAIVTGNRSMRAIFTYIEAVAKGSQPLLITGESGVGKELFARALHSVSGASGPLVAVNVAGLDDNVFADTLFGHVRGAFTGADEVRRGMIDQAAEGTLFLDEIGDLSQTSQVKLLRLIQEGEYYPLGSDTPRRLRARIVVATHRDLPARQRAGQFRSDLYYRLRAHHVHIPPLRERRDDLPLLLDHFLEQASREFGKKRPTYAKELLTLLSNYGFPGNLRELKSMVYDAVGVHTSRMLSMNAFIHAMGLPDQASSEAEEPLADIKNPFTACEELPTLGEAIDLLVTETMRRSENNQTQAARMLGISQPALSKRLKLRGK
ncbi:sigma-54 dependent transcriptional regulator [Geobacter sp. SVR]|uniref:sigma-54-dependent transcriptional regulator n=1 Tax=Geobacter sp. SVR TaxID=2495594 RepID=UPI00143EF78D|nr:sigma-54 dependent transcriptional regulator [Geobacter sp. SVR]BCS52731.1 sigma-54-dependent Fis family transcriptional regulator [Geobacter sp. SVR]GCF86773.1 sigma-54-dependent Fis family transcriptional regulator [Geobacter sp. SVR]